MSRELFHELARQGLRMPLGTDLVLREEPDAEAILFDGERLGRVVETAARRWQTPIAAPLMDLQLEKGELGRRLGFDPQEAERYFLDEESLERVREILARWDEEPLGARATAQAEAVRYVATRTDLVAVGMTIGPFSLMTKLVRDAVMGLALAGSGMGREESREVRLMEDGLAVAGDVVTHWVRRLLASGARAVLICEPAACVAFLSPRQMEAGSELFEREVLARLRGLKRLIEGAGAELILHDCGELSPVMVEGLAGLRPAVLSLGSSRRLWEDAALVPPEVVLYGNLPTKKFYSDGAMPDAEVERLTRELVERMEAIGRKFILGSECDVLDVAGAGESIRRKVRVMLTAGRDQ